VLRESEDDSNLRRSHIGLPFELRSHSSPLRIIDHHILDCKTSCPSSPYRTASSDLASTIVTPEGNKGKEGYKEKGSRTVSHVTRTPDKKSRDLGEQFGQKKQSQG